MQTINDIVALSVMFGVATLVAVLAGWNLAVAGGSSRIRLMGFALGVTNVAAFVAYWYLWGAAFDYADTNQAVPASVRASETITYVACAATSVLAAVLALINGTKKRRQEVHDHALA